MYLLLSSMRSNNTILRPLYCYLIILFSISFSCNNKDIKPNNNVTGKVIGEQLCVLGSENNFYLIQILDSQVEIGQSIIYYDGEKYDNVVEVNNLPNEYKSEGLILCFEYEIPEDKIIHVAVVPIAF